MKRVTRRMIPIDIDGERHRSIDAGAAAIGLTRGEKNALRAALARKGKARIRKDGKIHDIVSRQTDFAVLD